MFTFIPSSTSSTASQLTYKLSYPMNSNIFWVCHSDNCAERPCFGSDLSHTSVTRFDFDVLFEILSKAFVDEIWLSGDSCVGNARQENVRF